MKPLTDAEWAFHGKWLWIVVGLICLIPAVVKLSCYPAYPGSDDAFIHLAVIRNINDGFGWGINSHERVFLSTSPLFTMTLAWANRAFSDILHFGMGVSLVASMIAVWGVFRIASMLSSDRWLVLGCTFLSATNIHLWRWTGTFMETTLALASVTWLVWLYLRLETGDTPAERNPAWRLLLGGLCGLSAMLRPETGLLLPVFAAVGILNRRWSGLKAAALMTMGCLLAVAPLVWWAKSYFGSVLPTTFTAKTHTGLMVVNPIVLKQLAQVIVTGCGGTLIIGLASLPFMRMSGSPRTGKGFAAALLCVLVPLAAAGFYYTKTPGLQNPARYFLPFMSVLPLLILSIHLRPPGLLRILVIAGCLIQLAAALILNAGRVKPVLDRMTTAYVPVMSAAAQEINDRANPRDKVLVYMDIGVVATVLSRQILLIDGGELASPGLRGLSLLEKIRATKPRFVLESLGDDRKEMERTLDTGGYPVNLIWSRRFSSHSVGRSTDTYEVRLYELPGA